ncbi:hypothetical protein [Streptomyces sp. NPDC086023]|uniref:hypothetical protein n=1 Tax=Streptomyces sp. NPDC086023 TaxID=3365746 RepID=UPI0037D82130
MKAIAKVGVSVMGAFLLSAAAVESCHADTPAPGSGAGDCVIVNYMGNAACGDGVVGNDNTTGVGHTVSHHNQTTPAALLVPADETVQVVFRNRSGLLLDGGSESHTPAFVSWVVYPEIGVQPDRAASWVAQFVVPRNEILSAVVIYRVIGGGLVTVTSSVSEFAPLETECTSTREDLTCVVEGAASDRPTVTLQPATV